MITASSQCSRFAERDIGVDLRQVDVSVDGKDLLCDAHVQLKQGVHYGLIGRNGVGKSILFRCLADGSLLSPSLRESLRIIFVSQTLLDVPTELTVREEIRRQPFGLSSAEISELDKWRALADQRSGVRGRIARDTFSKMATAAAAEATSSQDDLAGNAPPSDSDSDPDDADEFADAHEVTDPAIERGLKAVGLNPAVLLPRAYATLSGGWKMRIQLAKAIIYRPDLLLLDEPTNHLDIAGVAWLQRLLRRRLGDVTVAFVSHNRAFLNAAAQEMIIFKNKKLEYFNGNYDAYVATKEEKRLYAERMQDALDRKRAHLEASVDAGSRLASKNKDDKMMKQVASRKTKLEERTGFERNEKGHKFKLNRDRPGFHSGVRGEVEHDQDEASQKVLKFPFTPPLLPRHSGPLLMVEGVWFRQRPTRAAVAPFEIRNVTFSVSAGERIAIVGANGQGKSTLLNLLTDTWTPLRGKITRSTQRVGYFRQHVVAELGEVSDPPMARLTARHPSERREALWQHLGGFGLGSAGLATDTPLSALSGGQRVAYTFAEMAVETPALLFLDEPNGHLDIDAADALAESLAAFEGGVVFVSHDESFVRKVATKAFWVEGGGLVEIDVEAVGERAKKCKARP